MGFEKNERNYWLVLSVAFVFFMIGQLLIPALGDDKLFATVPLSLNWITDRYTTWSSRIFIDSASIFLARNMWLFRILNAFIIVLLFDTFAKLTIGRKVETLFLLVLFFLSLPMTLFLSAGLVATSLNYLWPVTLIFYVISKMEENLELKNILGLSILVLFATNQEQVFVAFTLFLIGKIVSDVYTLHKVQISRIVFLCVTIVNLLIITLCPGNTKRTQWSIKALFPDFGKFNIWDKANLGVSNTSKVLLFQQNIFMMIFLVLLALVLLFTVRKWVISIVSLVPIIIVLPVNVFLSTLTGYGYNVATFSKYLLKKQTSPALNKVLMIVAKLLNHDVSLVWNTVFVIIFAFILLSIYFLKNNISLVFYYIVGLASHAMMGFSPTIFKSGDRTAIILYMVMIYIILVMLNQVVEKYSKRCSI